MELKKYKLSKVAKVEISSVDKKTKENETLVRLCNFTDVYYNWAITKELSDKFMVASANSNEIEKFSIKKGQVAFTKDSETRDDIGIPTYIADDFDNVLLGYHCALITPDESKVYGKYLNAFMHSAYIQKYFENSASGSGQRYTLSLETIEGMPLLLPSLEKQKTIGELFSSLDRKIALNRAINRNLESLAKQLYDYWFVQFDFPDENGRPYKSSGGKMVWNEVLKREVPEEWEVNRLGDLINLEDYKRVPLSSSQRANRKGSIPYYGATGIMDYIDDYIFDYDILLLAEDGSTSDGNGFPVVQYVWGKVWVNNHAHIIIPKDKKDLIYTYYMLKSIPVKLIETGSIQKKISQENLLNHRVLVVPEIYRSRYADIVDTVWEKRKHFIEEITFLTLQRDELLPLLMNGQVEVKQLNSDL